MLKTDRLADTPIVTSLDVLERIIDECVDVYNAEMDDIPDMFKQTYRAGWLGYRVLNLLNAGGYVKAGSRSDQITIDEVAEALKG